MEISEQDFKRFKRTMLSGPRAQFMLVGVTGPDMREFCKARIDQVLQDESAVNPEAIVQINVSADSYPTVPDFAAEVLRLSEAGAQVIHVIHQPGWVTQRMVERLNLYREQLARGAPSRLVFWFTDDEIRCFSMHAIDLWSWRSGPYRMYEQDETC